MAEPVGAGGRGVVKSLELTGSGPVGLLHTQDLVIKFKKPTGRRCRVGCIVLTPALAGRQSRRGVDPFDPKPTFVWDKHTRMSGGCDPRHLGARKLPGEITCAPRTTEN
jgi:hypothetical protein